MKYYFYPVFIFIIHLGSWGKLIYNHSNVWTGILLISCIGYIVFKRKELQQYPFVLSSLPVSKTVYVILLQSLFLVIICTSTQFHLQVVALLGNLVCEVIRMKVFPDQVKQIDYIDRTSRKMEEMNEHFLAIRSQRHDFLKHVSAIGFIVEQESNQEAKRYFTELLGEYEEINSTIKGEEVQISSILFKYKKIAEQIGTKVDFQFDIPVSDLPMNKMNQVQLITNLLENATDATRSFHSHFFHSGLTLHTEIHGGIYILVMKNSAYFEDRRLLDSLFDKFEISSKSEDHQGLGTYIISNIVKAHSGRLSYRFLNHEFMIKIKFPMITNISER
jgi:LytT family two-component system sensor histidine kinase NatK